MAKTNNKQNPTPPVEPTDKPPGEGGAEQSTQQQNEEADDTGEGKPATTKLVEPQTVGDERPKPYLGAIVNIDTPTGPNAAVVTALNEDGTVNLRVWPDGGSPWVANDVPHVHDEGDDERRWYWPAA